MIKVISVLTKSTVLLSLCNSGKLLGQTFGVDFTWKCITDGWGWDRVLSAFICLQSEDPKLGWKHSLYSWCSSHGAVVWLQYVGYLTNLDWSAQFVCQTEGRAVTLISCLGMAMLANAIIHVFFLSIKTDFLAFLNSRGLSWPIAVKRISPLPINIF